MLLTVNVNTNAECLRTDCNSLVEDKNLSLYNPSYLSPAVPEHKLTPSITEARKPKKSSLGTTTSIPERFAPPNT